MADGRRLGASADPLVLAYDLAMLDLDGVVYIGGEAVPGAASRLAEARAAGQRLAFVTNNASRPPDDVAAHLRELGVDADAADVVTSAQAAARVLRERFGAGAAVALLGGRGLDAALRAEELVPVAVGDQAVALVSGYGPDVLWREVMRAAVLVRDGLPWVASNTDLTIPTAYGTAPGHGVLVGLLSEFGGVRPEVAGKPERPLLDETVRRVGGRRPLMVGDRLDTDIDGARQRRLRQPSGDDRGDRPGAAGGGAGGPSADLRRARPGRAPGGPSGARADPRRRRARRLARHDRRRAASRSRVTARRATGGGSVAAAAWAWTDERDGQVDTTGLEPPSRSAGASGG